MRIKFLPLAIQTGAGALDGALAHSDITRSQAAGAAAGTGTQFTKQYTSALQVGLVAVGAAMGFSRSIPEDVPEAMIGSGLTLLARRGTLSMLQRGVTGAIAQGYASPRAAVNAPRMSAAGYQLTSAGGILS